LAYSGESAYELLEASYLLTLVGLFVPLILGLYSVPCSGLAAIASMLVGTAVWVIHLFLGWESFLEPLASLNRFPISLAATGCSLLAYFVMEPPWRIQWRGSKA
jgi:solute:Na+ symporter, SSS family